MQTATEATVSGPNAEGLPATSEALRRRVADLLWQQEITRDSQRQALAAEIMAVVSATLIAEAVATERERIDEGIADRQRAESARNIPPAGSTTQAYDYARRIVRGES